MLTVREFYAQRRWRDEWNVLRSDGSRHRGHDIACEVHEDIPLLRAGEVVVNGRTSVLGNYTVVQVDADEFDYYVHLLVGTRPNIGDHLEAGDRIAQAAGPNDDHGTAWSGTHLHYGSGPRKTSVTSGVTHDATRIIRAVLAAFAGGGTTSPPTTRKENDMPELYHLIGSADAQSRLLYALAGASPGTPANWRETRDVDGLATPWARRYGDSIPLSLPTWNEWKAQFLAPLKLTGVTINATPGSDDAVVAALAKVEAAVTRLNPPDR